MSGVAKARWTDDEDQRLRDAVDAEGDLDRVDWQRVSAACPGRTAKQCRERFKGALDPRLNRGPWTPDEVALVDSLIKTHGHAWGAIAKGAWAEALGAHGGGV
jgi:transcription factor MYB, plant